MTPVASHRDPPTSRWLRIQTRDEHRAVEASLRLDTVQHLADLARLLHGWRTVWRAVQLAACAPEACQQAADELLTMAVEALDWLEADLTELGCLVTDEIHDHPCPRCEARLTELLMQSAASWGVAYVLRGSRLGGTVIARHVRAALGLGLQTGVGTTFLASSGTEPGRDWVTFRRRLDGFDLSPAGRAAAADAARWTFRWIGAIAAAALGAVTATQQSPPHRGGSPTRGSGATCNRLG